MIQFDKNIYCKGAYNSGFFLLATCLILPKGSYTVDQHTNYNTLRVTKRE